MITIKFKVPRVIIIHNFVSYDDRMTQRYKYDIRKHDVDCVRLGSFANSWYLLAALELLKIVDNYDIVEWDE